jgi:hypothetical protein
MKSIYSRSDHRLDYVNQPIDWEKYKKFEVVDELLKRITAISPHRLPTESRTIATYSLPATHCKSFDGDPLDCRLIEETLGE